MKKVFLSSAALLLSIATAVPAGFAATRMRANVSGSYQSGVSRFIGQFQSRRQIQSHVWADRAQSRRGFIRPASFVTDQPSSASSASTASSESSTSSSASSATSSSAMSSSASSN